MLVSEEEAIDPQKGKYLGYTFDVQSGFHLEFFEYGVVIRTMTESMTVEGGVYLTRKALPILHKMLAANNYGLG